MECGVCGRRQHFKEVALLAYISGRLVSLMLTTLAASVIVFLLMQVLPGDPAAVILGINAQPETLAALHKQLGLDQPLWWRYLSWIGGFLKGDFGTSYTYSVPISELLGPRIMVTLPLALLSMILSVAVAIPVGVYAASKRGKTGDILSMGVAQVGVAIPNFWLGLLLILLFALQLGWFPASGFAGWENGFWIGIRSLFLPALALPCRLPQFSPASPARPLLKHWAKISCVPRVPRGLRAGRPSGVMPCPMR